MGSTPDSIFITLPSSVMPLTNRPGLYTTTLSKPIILDGSYEIGLRQLSYTKLWNNVEQGENIFYIRVNADVYRLSLDAGYYEPVQYLVEKLNEAILVSGGVTGGIQFGYSNHSHRLKLSLQGDRGVIFKRNSGLSKLIGAFKKPALDETSEFVMYDSDAGYVELPIQQDAIPNASPAIYIKESYDGKGVTVSKESDMRDLGYETQQVARIVSNLRVRKLAALADGQKSGSKIPIIKSQLSTQLQSEVSLETVPRLYVYCSDIESVHVGDIQSPLLAIVSTRGKHSEQVQEYFDQPFFVPTYKTSLYQITLKICNERGAIVNFNGEVVCVLQVRRRGRRRSV